MVDNIRIFHIQIYIVIILLWKVKINKLMYSKSINSTNSVAIVGSLIVCRAGHVIKIQNARAVQKL